MAKAPAAGPGCARPARRDRLSATTRPVRPHADVDRTPARRLDTITLMGQAGTYARARGLFPRVVEPLSRRAREHRVEQFRTLTGARPASRIVDVGCGGLGLISLAGDLDITGVDLHELPEYAGRLVRAAATERLPL